MSLRVVRRRKRIVLLPVLGVLALGLLLATFVAGTVVTTGGSVTQILVTGVLFILLSFILNLILYSLLVLVNAAVAVFALELFDGKTPTVFGSLRTTFGGGRRIFGWAAIAALIASILRLAQQGLPQLRYEFALGGFIWTFFVPLVAPVVLFEGVGPFRAVRRSTTIRRGTWIEGLGGLASVYAIFILAALLGLIPPIAGYLLGGPLGLVIGLLIAFVYWVPLFFAGSTTKAVLVAVVYRYGTTGEIPNEFRASGIAAFDKTTPADPRQR